MEPFDEEHPEEDDAGPGDEAPASPGAGGVVLLKYTVEPNYAGWRLDKYLTEKIRRASRTRVQEIIANDLVYERRLKASTRRKDSRSIRIGARPPGCTSSTGA